MTTRNRVLLGLLCATCSAAATAYAGDLALSDPASSAPPPAWAVGQADRSPDLDVLPGFQKPRPGFGVVPFFWWLGDPLTKERLGWILQQMDGMGIASYQINYAHSDQGGRSYGLTFPSDPPLFSDDWWKLVGWFMQEAKKQGSAVSLSDYTLGIGQGWCMDEVLHKHPETSGMILRMDNNGKVGPVTVPLSFNPMHPMAGKWYAEEFFGRFERHFPGEAGKGFNYFFSDELGFGVGGWLWSEQFSEEFRRRKGYDVRPELAALFKDIGPRTPKVRMDYSDVMVSLIEEGYFKPIYEWHQQRGMTMGCDHGGRGRNVVEFGDYFRTQRWMQGPGADQPGLGKNLIKTKVAASIAHLYQRPRVWLEGYYGSGWGTTSAGVVDATFTDFVMGYNLLAFHGMYYSTHGGWWEWAPPDNTFRMPYWKHMRPFMDCVQRLAYLFTQGHHRCDVAIVYPVAPMEAGMDGPEAVKTAFATGEQFYGRSIDFDFMDFESLARAKVVGKELHVSGEVYRVLVLPAIKAVRHSTLEKAREFHRAGGIVLAVGALPEASDRVGRNDPEVAAMVKELFPDGPTKDVLSRLPDRDYGGPGCIQHRRLGPRDLYAVYNAPKDTECFFRATGMVELWDPWTGRTRPLAVTSQTAAGTKLCLPLSEREIQLIVFSPGEPMVARQAAAGAPPAIVPLEGDWEFELEPTCDNRFGDFHWPPTHTVIGAEVRQFRYADEANAKPGWQDPKFDDARWRKVTVSFGPQFWKLGPLPASGSADSELVAQEQVDPSKPVLIGGKSYRWQPYEFSWRYGIEGNPGHQGYHGLKESVTDNFIGLGSPKAAKNETAFGPEPAGTRYYLWTSVPSSSNGRAQALVGTIKPTAAWLNHERMAANGTAQLHAGSNPLLLRYDKPERTFFVFSHGAAPASAITEDASGDSLFSPSAFWIWLDPAVGERGFRKVFTVTETPAKARLRVTGDDRYSAWLNGKEIGTGQHWQRVQEFDVTGQVCTGANAIGLIGHNGAGPAGVIAELTLTDRQGRVERIATDARWRALAIGEPHAAAPAPNAALLSQAAFDDSGWKPAQPIAAYAGSLWATHPSGAPQLDVRAASASPGGADDTEHYGTLAMRWHNNPDIIPFDTRPQAIQPVGWYRFVSPPGFLAMRVETRGKVRAWANGVDMRAEDGGRFAVVQPSAAPVTVAIRVEQQRGSYAGAAIPEPIRLECGTGAIAAGDWSRIDGLACYSGGVWYRKTVRFTKEQASGTVVIDLGDVVSSAEVRVNGQGAGVRLSPPWRVDISTLVKAGENRIEILVYNTLANHYATIPTRYRGKPTSGLLGPVTLELTAGGKRQP